MSQRSSVRNVPGQLTSELLLVVRINVGVILSAGNLHVGQPTIDQFVVAQFGIHVDEHAVDGLALADVLGNSVSVCGCSWRLNPTCRPESKRILTSPSPPIFSMVPSW
jgi:hypothetical protein